MSKLKDFIDAFKVKHETVVSKGLKLQVVENKKLKMFKLDDVTHSVINKRSVYTHSYWDYFLPLFHAYRNPRVLMIGLGMGTTAYQLRKLFGKRVGLDIVDNNADVVKLARKHSPNLEKENIVVADGARYLEKSGKKYDVVVLDVYEKAARIPEQFLKERFVRSAFKSLKNDGVMGINYAMNPLGIVRFGAYVKVLKRHFKVYSIKAGSIGDMQVILCSKSIEKEELLGRIEPSMKINRATSPLVVAYNQMRTL